MDDADLERAIEGTALRRAGVRGLRRNLAVAIGNAGRPLASLLEAKRPSLEDPIVAEHVDWARAQGQ
jgi:epoxyqueuosine reductase QueG